MSFVRPEAQRAVRKWRDVLVAAAVLVLGAYWAFATPGLLHWIGYVVIVAGLSMLFVGIQRARFRAGQGGPGVVHVDEGQVAYFGPLTGGVVALREMTCLMLDPTAKPAHWVLSQPGQADLQVPVSAEGAEGLFDAFTSLPGIRTERMLAEMKRGADHPVVIWQKHAPRLH